MRFLLDVVDPSPVDFASELFDDFLPYTIAGIVVLAVIAALIVTFAVLKKNRKNAGKPDAEDMPEPSFAKAPDFDEVPVFGAAPAEDAPIEDAPATEAPAEEAKDEENAEN